MIVGYMIRASRQRTKHIISLENESELNQRLIESHEHELDELHRAWEISEEEVTISRKIDEGAFGEVSRFPC